MTSITVTTPDGVPKTVEHGTRALDVLKAAGVLNNQVVAARVNGRVIDLARPLVENGELAPVSADSGGRPRCAAPLGRPPDGAGREAPVPDVQVTIGPVIDNGFYYDFKRAAPFTRGRPRTHRGDDARDHQGRRAGATRGVVTGRRRRPVSADGEDYKSRSSRASRGCGFALPAGRVCRPLPRPHVPSTGRLKAFKLTSVAVRTGGATPATRCCSASTAPRGRTRRTSRPT